MRIPLLATAALALVFSSHSIAQETQRAPHVAMKHEAMQSSPGAEKAPFELQFIDTMIVHHQDAIEMAQLAEERSMRSELRQLAQEIIQEQQAEIAQLSEWRKEWYPDRAAAINMKMPGMTQSMSHMSVNELAASKGAAFDALFIDLMILHHQGAIQMSKAALRRAERPEIKELAEFIADEQEREIRQMMDWKREWRLAGR
jgi:uncharacterized protein (DUF305 family)